MEKTRLEAFSDGVFAIIITIMILEMKVPHGSDWHSLRSLLPGFTSYILSFLFAGIYWGNHHHLLHTIKKINSPIMLANLNLLFWLSLIPIATGWMGENNFASNPVAVYGILLMVCGLSFTILQKQVERKIPPDHPFRSALKKTEMKGLVSVIVYAISIPVAFVNPVISTVLFFGVSVMWIVPDKNIEKAIKEI